MKMETKEGRELPKFAHVLICAEPVGFLSDPLGWTTRSMACLACLAPLLAHMGEFHQVVVIKAQIRACIESTLGLFC